MSRTLAVWRAHLVSARSAWRNDRRARIGWSVAGLFYTVAALWLAGWLAQTAGSWRASGQEEQLWLLALAAAGSAGFFSFLATTQQVGGERAELLLTLPLPPVIRYRIVCGLVAVEGVGTWLALGLVAGLGLLLGGAGWEWSLLVSVTTLAGAWTGMTALLLAVRYILPDPRRLGWLWLAAMGLALGAAGLMALFRPGMDLRWLGQPLTISLLLILWLAVMAGPAAGRWGKLYEAAARVINGRSVRRDARHFPVVRQVVGLLYYRRSLTAALLAKGWLNRSRNPLTWLRLLMLGPALLLFSWLRPQAADWGFSDLSLVTACASLLAVLTLLDNAPSPFGGEGNRLALLLVAPVSPAGLLRARYLATLAPSLFIVWLLCGLTGLMAGLNGRELALSLLLAGGIVAGVTGLLVGGSVWDEDLEQPVEGPVQTFLTEEAPVTARRIGLFNLCLALTALAGLLLWQLPGQAVPLVLLLSAAWLWLGQWVGLKGLARLVRPAGAG